MIKTVAGFLRSVKLAVALIIIIALLSVIGIILPQASSEFTSSPEAYGWWIENVAYSQIGDIAYTLEPLGLFDVFHSVLFVAASGLLMINILFCTLSRLKKVRSAAKKTEISTDPDCYEQGRHIYEFETPGQAELIAQKANSMLQNLHYSVIQSKNAKNVYIAADKRRFSPWGTVFVHLSLLLLIAGIFAGVYFGFRNDSFIVAENSSKDIGEGTALSVYLESFNDEYWEDGTPKDYRSNVSIYENGNIVKSGTVRVNHPLSYKGIRIHQGFFGPAASLTITDESGAVVFRDSVPLDGMRVNDSLHRPEGKVSLPQNDYSIILLGSAVNGSDPYIAEGQVGVEFYDADMEFIGWLLLDNDIPQQMGDLTFTYENLQYSGFMVSKDPGTVFLGIAAILFLAGLIMMFYLPRRQVLIRMYKASKDAVRIWIKFSYEKTAVTENESSKITAVLGLKEESEQKN